MNKCLYEDQIDDYLLNRLPAAEKEKFEEHYFNCLPCFELTRQRDEMIRAVKTRGAEIFGEEPRTRESRAPAWYQNVLSFLTPRQWAVAAVSAAVVLITVFGVLPTLKHGTPQFYLSEGETVRGSSIQAISPLTDVTSVPASFEWKSLGGDVEYQFYLSNRELLWKGSTRENSIALPDGVKNRMIAGEKYFWQVKAFSSKGTLIAVSSRIQFKISKAE